jgi:hypothetical protein
LPNLCGSEGQISQTLASAAGRTIFRDRSPVDFGRIRSACAIALLLPAELSPVEGDPETILVRAAFTARPDRTVQLVQVYANPELARPVSQLVSSHPNWLNLAPALMVTAIAIETASTLHLLVKRIWFREIVFFDATVWILAMGIAGVSFQPVIQRGLKIRPARTPKSLGSQRSCNQL